MLADNVLGSAKRGALSLHFYIFFHFGKEMQKKNYQIKFSSFIQMQMGSAFGGN
jgi:hypothetical protein